MAKKQTRRSISVSRTTYERLKAFCETNHISMSQLVETRVNDYLGANGASDVAPMTTLPNAAFRPAPVVRPTMPSPSMPATRPIEPRVGQPSSAAAAAAAGTATSAAAAASSPASSTTVSHSISQPVPMTSAAARFAVEPPPPIIKPRQETAAPKPAEKRPEQIFTF